MMKIYSYIILFFSALFLTFFAGLSADTYQYEGQIIQEIKIISGTQAPSSIDENVIKSRLKSKEHDLFSHANFDQDLKMLSTEFDYVDPLLEPLDKNIRLTLKVWPKPIIRRINWCGNNRIDTDTLQGELNVKPLSIFDRLAFNKAFQAVKAYYVKKGFFEAQLDYSIKYNEVTNEVEIDIQVQEGRAGKIKSIILKNFTPEEESEILNQMVTKEYWFITSWLTDAGTYREEAMQHDEYVILNYLQNKGYADARVSIEVDESTQADRIIIYVTADKGMCYTFGELTFEGNTLYSDEEIQALFTFCEGDLYSPEVILSTVRNISNYYGRHGYIDAYVDYEPRLNANQCAYALHLKIVEGEQYHVGLIKVMGNCSTQTNVILHEVLLVPGQIFNVDKMLKTEIRLKNIGYFQNVNVYAVKSQTCIEGQNYRDLHIEVEETSTGRFGLSLGYSTVESLFGSINVTENNFNYKGLSCLHKCGYPALRGGGEFLSLNVTLGAKSRSYGVSWSKPFFMDTPWLVGFDLERSTNRYISDDYAINATQFMSHGVYNVNDFFKTGVHYRLRNSEIDLNKKHVRIDEDDSPEEIERKIKSHHALEKEAKNSGLISAIGFSLIYDSTDDLENPRCGFRSRLDVECAGLGGRYQFGSLAYVNSYFYPIGSRSVIRLRGDLRFIQPFLHTSRNGLPIDERLFLGGNTTIRGYRAYKLGPQRDNEPIGGISLQFASAEFGHQFHPRIEGFVFCDSGFLGGRTWQFGKLRTAMGFGTRLQVIPNGPPLTIGMGFPFTYKKRGEVKRFFLTLGGRF